MPRKEVFNLTIDVGANISQAQSAAKSLQQAFSKVNLTDSLKKGLDKTFGDLERELNNFASMTSKPFTNMKDVEKAEKSFEKINDLLNDLQVQGKTIAGMDLSKFLPNDTVNKVRAINDQIKDFKKTIDGFNNQKLGILDDISKLRKEINDTQGKIDRLKIGKTEDTLSDSEQRKIQQYQFDIQRATEKIAELGTEMEKVNNQSQEFSQQGLLEIKRAFAEVAGIKVQQVPRTIEGIQEELSKLTAKQIEEVKKALESGTPAAQKLAEALGLIKPPLDAAGQEAGELSEVAKEVQRLGEQVKQFFSIGNTIQLFKRAVRDAMNTVKELDATMTETATVTDFSISDMWEQLPRYTDEANKLGTSINSLYKATTLYYQQGLQTEEAMALGIETIKMARVANMDAALATDLMTAALRGFNMELNEMSAVRINDVYSELAAVTAADTDEIGIAISKTASIAHSANMEFETTAAFLSQIIETTREAPETAGTAMKTIIARFSEVKKLYSEGQILGTDEEGEAINVNKIQEALRTVGIDMTKFFVGAEGLDDVLLRLAEKWDTLDVATQRYIATQAAGSRQQSRFLAMMSDYDRTMELVDAAYDSAGSGQAQFEKTLDSMQAKLTELKNAWDQFVMGLANNEILKTGVDILTGILSTINDIISAVSGGNGLVKSILSLGSAFLALRGGAKLFGSSDKDGWIQKILGIAKKKDVENDIRKTSEQIGAEVGTHIGNGIDKSKNFIKDKISSFFTKENFGFTITEENIENVIAKNAVSLGTGQLTTDQIQEVRLKFTQEGGDAALKLLQDFGVETSKTKILLQNWQKTTKATGEALIGLGTAITVVGSLISKGNEDLGNSITAIGQVVMAVGSVVALIPSVVSGIKAIASALNVASGPIGWVIAGITALISVLTILSQFTPEKQLERAEEKAKKSAQAAQEAQQAYDDLLSNRNNYNQLEEKVKSLTKGTEEWKDAVAELNSKVLELVQNYEGLEIVYDSEGNMSISQESWDKIEQQQKTKTNKATATALSDRINSAKIKLNNTQSNDFAYNRYRNNATDEEKSYADIMYEMGANENTTREDIEDYISKNYKIVPSLNVDTREAEKELEIARKNMILAFMPKSIDKTEANQVGKALTTLIGDAIDNESDPEKIQKTVDNYYNEFNKLTDDQKALLSGDFSAVGSDKVDTNNIEDKEIKEKVEEQRILYEKALKDTRNELQRLTGVYSTDFGLFGLDKGSALKLTEKTSSMGSSAAKAYYESWKKIREENEDLAENLLNFDVTDFRSLTNLTDYMREQGLNEDDAEEYWRAMVNGAKNFTATYGQIASWAEGIKESMKGVAEMVERLESGKLTADDLTAFENAGLNTSNRLLTADGYKVFGVDSQEARRALNQANAEKAQRDLNNLNKVGSDIGHLGAQDQREIDHYAEMLNLTKQKDETEEEFIKRIQDEWARTREIAEETNDYAQAAVHTADEWAALGGTDKQIRYATMQEASDAGLDVNELITYSDWLRKTADLSQATADRIALDNMKMNASIEELKDNFDKWKATLEAGSGAADYGITLEKLRSNMKSLLGITTDLSDNFLTNADNMDLMARAAEGDGDAIDELRKRASQDIIVGIGIDDQSSTELNSLMNELTSQDYEIGATLDNSQILDSIYDILVAAGATTDEIQSYFDGLGWEPQLETESYTLQDKDVRNGYVEVPEFNGEGIQVSVRRIPIDASMTAGATIQIPKVRGKNSHVSASYKGSASTTVNANNRGGGSGGKKGGGGGGGSSKKQDNWKNPYDKYYNLTEKINEALRTREKIERDYDRILKRRERTAAELLKNSAQEIANLRQEIVYQQRLQAGRREQIQNLAKERYDNGDQRTTFEQMGVTKYANYNFDTQTIEIDWAAIEAVRDEELGKAIEAYVGRLEELQGQYEDTQTTIEDMEDTIWEINQRGKEEYLNFESRIIDALINADQKLIDDLSAKFDSINEANSRVLSSMQESIDLERQIRDNTKTEDDIASKEARLAYLRRDTSGANQMEIMKLEQDLADARQNYSDQLIDQGMQKLSDENERAAEQRQEQIDIMQAIHDWTVQSGGFNAKANELIAEAAKAGEVTDAIKDLLWWNEDGPSMTQFAGENWMSELANEYKAAMEGLSNFKEESARLEYSKSKPLTLETGEKVWFDDTLGRWVDAANNLYDIQYNTATGGYTRASVTSSNEADPNAWLKDYLDKMITALGDKDSGTPSSGSGGNGGSSGSSGSGSGGKTPTPTPTRYKYDATIASIKFTGSGFNSSSSAMTDLLNKIKNKRKQLNTSGNNDPSVLNQIWTLDDYINGKKKLGGFIKSYKTGGLNSQTGLAWLDGTKSHPELVLNARDTENFIQLKDILSEMGSLDKLQNGGDNYYNFDIKVDQLANDYDVDKLIGKIKNEINKDATYRNVNAINLIR